MLLKQHLKGYPQGYSSTRAVHGVLPSLDPQPNDLGRVLDQRPPNAQLSESQRVLQASVLNSPIYANPLGHSMPAMAWCPGSPPWAASYPAFLPDTSGYCQQPTPYAFDDQYYSDMTIAEGLSVDPSMLQHCPATDQTYNSISPGFDGTAAMISFANIMPTTLQGQEYLEDALLQVGEIREIPLAPCPALDHRTLNTELDEGGYHSRSPASDSTITPVSSPQSLDSNGPQTPSSLAPQTGFTRAVLDTPANRQTVAPPSFHQIVEELTTLGNSLHSNAQNEITKFLEGEERRGGISPQRPCQAVEPQAESANHRRQSFGLGAETIDQPSTT
ncbi:hypothetical protein F5Y18DRAFT_433526 [Xylariaceae sp. FL1019]|nr:hypothetical protein F5Y18DRAFT_433526 [Xylariaceae sp. FL1019]